MTRDRVLHTTALIAAAGGAAWLVKFALILATSGETTSGGPVAVFYFLGVLLLMVGAATVTLRLVPPASRVLTVIAALAAPVVAFASFVVLESIAKAVVGDAGAEWLNDEVGILLTGLVWLAAGALLAQRPANRPAVA